MTITPPDIQLHLAARTSNILAVSHLLATGSDPNAVLKIHLYPEDLVKNFKVDLWTPLHCAVDVQAVEVTKLLINHRADVNVEDEYGRTPLNLAASRGNVPIVQCLLNAGAYVDSSKYPQNDLSKFRIGEPLHSAVEANNVDITRMLLESKANVVLTDRWDRTPLFLSILEGNSEIVQLLLDHGADLQGSADPLEKGSGRTALHFISEKLQVKIMKLLSTKFAVKFNEKQRILNLCFYRNFKDANCRDESHFEEVIRIIEEDDRVLRILLERGLDVNAVDVDGCSPLHIASREGNWRIVKTLLENGAEVDLQENSGKTALHFAMYHKRRAIVEVLLDYEANFLISDLKGLTPLNYHCKFCPEFDLESHVVRIEILRITDKEYQIQDVLSYFERKCFDELFRLKVERFGCGPFSYSFHQVFTEASRNKLLRLSRNDEFCTEVFSEDFYKKFPTYVDIFRGRLEKARWRSGLLDRGFDALTFVLEAVMPQSVLEEILSYLSNADVVNLIRLYEQMNKTAL